jgi:mRNA-degrading endonuclease toxin of MazEF toxin-antitoxin module
MRSSYGARKPSFLSSTTEKPPMPEPQRGDVWVVDLGLAAKVRPCLILSVPVAEQDRALVTVVAHTTSPRGARFEVVITTRFLRPGVFDAQNLVTIPRAKLRFTPYFGDVWRGLVSPVLQCPGATHCYAVSTSHVGPPPPLLAALHVPHHDRCCDRSCGSSRWRTRQPPPSGTRG